MVFHAHDYRERMNFPFKNFPSPHLWICPWKSILEIKIQSIWSPSLHSGMDYIERWVPLQVLTSAKFLWKGNTAQGSLGLLFALLTLSLIQVPLLLGRYSEETHIVVNPTYQIAWTGAREDKEGAIFTARESLHVWDSGWSLNTAKYSKLLGFPSLCSTLAL